MLMIQVTKLVVIPRILLIFTRPTISQVVISKRIRIVLLYGAREVKDVLMRDQLQVWQA